MLIDFNQICLKNAQRPILRDITLRLAEHRTAIIGANGSGKSSLIRLINGLITPESGSVTVNGMRVSENVQAVRRQVGMVFQNPDNQIVFPVVSEDLAFGLKNRIADPALRAQRITQTLARLGIEHLVDRAIHQLSGGEKQLVALAAVLCLEPAFLVMDEPTTQLDLRYTLRLKHILSQLPQPIVMVTHDLTLVEDFDRVIVIQDGTVALDAPPAQAIQWYVQSMQDDLLQ